MKSHFSFKELFKRMPNVSIPKENWRIHRDIKDILKGTTFHFKFSKKYKEKIKKIYD